ncbi:DNA processing dprA domain protein [Francisella philomiragia]|uniref:hypothetical protein n=1 Tax=Francisella philomiragia TaxID=28110 RepID=UPI000306AA98|nr:hypothetical protein [Francisella philomiragia]AJI47627.1 DNA processing dprA domain protein [Francisella philomiragia]AJI49933.1 DNA processing dprA domain protein [Francisella philomiragia]
MNNTTRSIIALSCTPHFGNSRLLKALELNINFNDIIDNPNKYTLDCILKVLN